MVELDRTFEAVPARLVHKLAADEVLLNCWRRVGNGDFQLTTRWPHKHDFYFAPDGRPDPMLLIETVRQCLPLLSHAAFDVPLDHHLVWETFALQITPGALDANRPRDNVEITAHCDDLRVRAGRTTRLTLSFVLHRHGARLATARTTFSIQPPAVYRRIRGEAAEKSSASAQQPFPPTPLAAATVSRWTPSDVLLSATDRAGTWQLRVDPAHPIFFDHPVDHVPGALLLDAALQAARATAHEDRIGPACPVAIECDFAAFIELDDTCRVEARRESAVDQSDRERVRITFTQHKATPAFSAVVTLRRTLTIPPQRPYVTHDLQLLCSSGRNF